MKQLIVDTRSVTNSQMKCVDLFSDTVKPMKIRSCFWRPPHQSLPQFYRNLYTPARKYCHNQSKPYPLDLLPFWSDYSQKIQNNSCEIVISCGKSLTENLLSSFVISCERSLTEDFLSIFVISCGKVLQKISCEILLSPVKKVLQKISCQFL